MKRICLSLMLGIVAVGAFAQLSLEDVISGGKNFYKYYMFNYDVKFKGESNDLVIQRNDSVFFQSINDNQIKYAFNKESLNNILKDNGLEGMKYLPRLTWESSSLISFSDRVGYYLVDLNGLKVDFVAKPEGAENIDWISLEQKLAYTKGNSLYLISNGEEQEVGISELEGIVYGTSVHRNEFGITKGTYWSPDGSKLAFYRKDETMVTDYPLVNIEPRVAELENIKYPMAGMTSHEVTVGVYDLKSKTTLYLKTGEPKDRFFTNICWTPDGKYLLVAELNREQNHMYMNKYDVVTGDLVATLFEEKDDKWVEPQHPALFIPGKNNQFIWQSVKDGYNHLYLYNTDGKLIKQLTKGNWEVTDIIGFDDKAKNLFISATKETPLESHAYRVNLASGKMNRITAANGVHRVIISKDGKYAVSNYRSLDQPVRTVVYSTVGKELKELKQAKNPYENMEIGKIKMVELTTKDGETPLYGRLVLPTNFDPAKKYPVIVYVYGGPHVQQIQNTWQGGVRGWQLYMAQKGYIAFTMDNRGTPSRGKDFEQAIHRQLGTLEVEDQMQGIEYLKSLPYVDADRIGVHGWSYGGFMTISLMTEHPEVFKVGVAGGPVIDWKYYEIMYGERYMDTPQENPEGYEKSNLNNKVNQLEGRLMVIHGAIDPTVVWQHSLSFVCECVKNGVQLDYFVYPRHEHNVRGHDRIHLMEKVSRYFDDFL
nr:DPP IV N-terminal domain-containing protein [uncultured Carboxylicivirga sp.]